MSEYADLLVEQPEVEIQPSREQEGWAHSLSVGAGEALTCSSYFSAYHFSLNDFRGPVRPDGGFNPAHRDNRSIEWETSPAETEDTTTFVWIGGSQVRPVSLSYPPAAATLYINDVSVLQFPVGRAADWNLSNDGVTLRFEYRRFQSLVEDPHRSLSPDGVSGFYRLDVPVRLLQMGHPLRLRVELESPPAGIESLLYVSPRNDALRTDLGILRSEVSQLQRDLVQLRKSHELLFAQFYRELFPRRIQGKSSIILQEPTLHLHPPCVTVLRDGEIIVTMRAGTDHLALDGRMMMVRSTDNGETWTDKELLFDLGNCDHRGSPIFELPNGDWVTTDYRAGDTYTGDGVWDVKLAANGATLWAVRSEDRGKNWTFSEEPLTVPGASFEYAEVERHMIRLDSGRLLVPANYVESTADGVPANWAVYHIAIFASDDDGRTWYVLAQLPRHTDTIGEATLLRTASGRIILLSRVQANGIGGVEKGGLLQCDSLDDGLTWGEWHQTGMSSMDSPAHLLQLQDGRILCTHSSRTYPLGIYATVSHDEGVTWDMANTKILANDIPDFDSTYPTSGQMADGTIISVWYASLFGKFYIRSLRYSPDEL